MSIFDIFTAKPEPAPQQQTSANGEPGNIPAPTTVADPKNPTAPVNSSNSPNLDSKKDDSPLAQFTDLWDTKSNEGGNEGEPPSFALKAEEVQKIMAKTDFSSSITPETLSAITAGGEDATKAFAAAMNAVAQQVMVQSTMVNNKLTEQAVDKAVKYHTSNLPKLLRSQATADHSKTTNPIFSNPAVKPVIEATQQQLLQKFPDATPAQIAEMTQNYILAMGDAFRPAPTEPSNSKEVDWDKFLQ